MDGRILAGEVAWYVTGRFYLEGKKAFDAGYFIHVQGIEAPLFSGERSEATAYLTFLAEPFESHSIQNGDLTVGLDPVGEFGVYLRDEPGASFSDPRSFGRGMEVARFRRVSVAVGTTVGSGTGDAGLFTANVFSAWLIHSRTFELGGHTYDFGRLMPNGITQWGTAALTSTGTPPGLPFVGSAIAIGGGGQ